MDKNINIEQQKALHTLIRSDAKLAAAGTLKRKIGRSNYEGYIWHRYMLLLWSYVRGFKFRRIERSHRMDCGKEMLDLQVSYLTQIWQHYLPELTTEDVQVWLNDPSGAIAAPPPRPKRVYVQAAE